MAMLLKNNLGRNVKFIGRLAIVNKQRRTVRLESVKVLDTGEIAALATSFPLREFCYCSVGSQVIFDAVPTRTSNNDLGVRLVRPYNAINQINIRTL